MGQGSKEYAKVYAKDLGKSSAIKLTSEQTSDLEHEQKMNVLRKKMTDALDKRDAASEAEALNIQAEIKAKTNAYEKSKAAEKTRQELIKTHDANVKELLNKELTEAPETPAMLEIKRLQKEHEQRLKQLDKTIKNPKSTAKDVTAEAIHKAVDQSTLKAKIQNVGSKIKKTLNPLTEKKALKNLQSSESDLNEQKGFKKEAEERVEKARKSLNEPNLNEGQKRYMTNNLNAWIESAKSHEKLIADLEKKIKSQKEELLEAKQRQEKQRARKARVIKKVTEVTEGAQEQAKVVKEKIATTVNGAAQGIKNTANTVKAKITETVKKVDDTLSNKFSAKPKDETEEVKTTKAIFPTQEEIHAHARMRAKPEKIDLSDTPRKDQVVEEEVQKMLTDEQLFGKKPIKKEDESKQEVNARYSKDLLTDEKKKSLKHIINSLVRSL